MGHSAWPSRANTVTIVVEATEPGEREQPGSRRRHTERASNGSSLTLMRLDRGMCTSVKGGSGCREEQIGLRRPWARRGLAFHSTARAREHVYEFALCSKDGLACRVII